MTNFQETLFKITDRPNKYLEAKKYFSGFILAHYTYNTISCASDGNIHYILSSESLEGRLFQLAGLWMGKTGFSYGKS